MCDRRAAGLALGATLLLAAVLASAPPATATPGPAADPAAERVTIGTSGQPGRIVAMPVVVRVASDRERTRLALLRLYPPQEHETGQVLRQYQRGNHSEGDEADAAEP